MKSVILAMIDECMEGQRVPVSNALTCAARAGAELPRLAPVALPDHRRQPSSSSFVVSVDYQQNTSFESRPLQKQQ
jgi:hypothetical protein